MDSISGMSGINAESGKMRRMAGSTGKSPGINTSDSFTPGAVYNKTDDMLKRAADLLAGGNTTERMKGAVWQFETGSQESITSTPVLPDKDNLVFRDSNHLYSINPKTGRKNWEFGTGTWSSDAPQRGKGDIIYTGRYSKDRESLLCALDYKTGKKIWEKPAGDEITSYIAGDDGNLYMGSNRKNLFALDGTTGEKLWEAPNDKYVHVVGTNDKGLVIFNNYNRKTFALDSKTGEMKWEHEAVSDYQVTQKICPDGNIAVKTSKGMTLLDGKTGEEKWSKDVGKISTDLVFDADGNAYFGVGEEKGGSVRKISMKDGEELWRQETREDIRTPPVLHNDIVLTGDTYGFIYSNDAKTGKLNRQDKSGSSFAATSESIIPLNDDTLVVGHTYDGGGSKWASDFSRIDMKTGEIIKEYKCPSKKYLSQPHVNFNKSMYDFIGPVTLSVPDKETGLLYVGTEDGKMIALGKPSDITANAMRNEEPEEGKKVVLGEQFVEIGGVKLNIRQYNFLYPFGL